MPWKMPSAVGARIAGAAVLDRAAEDVTRPLAHHVHVRSARVHVGAGQEAAAERLDEIAVPLEQPPARRSLGHVRHREHAFPAAVREAEHGELPRHPAGEPHRVAEPVRGRRIGLHSRPASRRPEAARVDANEHPGPALGVVADDGVLAVPRLEQLLDHSSRS
jgi:hypothetical protein